MAFPAPVSYALIGVLAVLVALGGAISNNDQSKGFLGYRHRSWPVTMPACKTMYFQNYTVGPRGFSDIPITPENIAFASSDGKVLAVRYIGADGKNVMSLVVAKDDGTCTQESSVLCSDPESEVLAPLATDTSSVCKLGCAASSEPVISYLRTMISGVFHARGSQKITRALMLGLGAGAVPLWFSGQMPETSFYAVDINEDVVRAAPCFGLKESPAMHLIKSDGIEFLKKSEETFDVIFVDVFDGDDMPPQFTSADFFDTVRQKLSADGVLVMDLHPEDEDSCVTEAKKQFNTTTIYIGQSPGLANKVLLAGGLPGDRPTNQFGDRRVPPLWAKEAAWEALA